MISEQLRITRQRVQKVLLTGALAMAAVTAPVKGQAKDVAPENESGRTFEASQTQKSRQQMFESAIRAEAPKDEIVKYMEFPEYIPVTESGAFDSEKADCWSKKLTPYLETLVKKGKTMSAVDAYKVFKKSTGQQDISMEDFERVCKMANEAVNNCGDKFRGTAAGMLMTFFVAGLACVAGSKTYEMGKEIVNAIRRKDCDSVSWLKGAATIGLGGISAFTGMLSVAFGMATGLEITNSPEREIRQAYSRMYKTYVDESIKIKRQQMQKLEWEQVKAALQKEAGN